MQKEILTYLIKKKLITCGIGILSSLTLGVSIMNDVQPIFAYEKNTENKNIKKVEKSKKETKKDKAFKINMNGKENQQIEDILISIVNNINENNQTQIENQQINYSNVNKTTKESITPNDLKKSEFNMKEIKKLDNSNNSSTDYSTKSLNTDQPKDAYLYDNYLITTDSIDTKKQDIQNIDVEVRMLSMIDKKLLQMTENTSLLNTSDSMKQNNDINKEIKNIQIKMNDITSPKIELNKDKKKLTKGEEFNPDDFIKSVEDKEDGNLKYEIKGTVDVNTPGIYELEVIAKDANGNKTKEKLQIEIIEDLQTSFYDKIANAALAQLGVYQDCTMLVTNALKAVGINFRGWPTEYLSLGTLTNTPVPGDICVYEGHVALYIGNGQAVHGGWMGNQTVISSVHTGQYFYGYVHVTPPSNFR